MKEVIYVLCCVLCHAGSHGQGGGIGVFYCSYVLEVGKQCLSALVTYSRYVIKYGVNLGSASETSVVLNGKSVGFVLQSCDHVKCLRIRREFYFLVVVVKTSGPVVVILYHATYRDIYVKIIEYLKGNVHLTFTTIHHKDIRVDVKTLVRKSSV